MEFRPVRDDDLPTLHQWLNEPGVVRWWEGADVSWEAVVRDHAPGPGGTRRADGTEHFLALVGDVPVGWIQCYLAADDPDDDEVAAWFVHGLPRTTAGIDYLVAEPSRRGGGLGQAMIDAFVERVVFALHPGWTHVAASPYVANEASWRALAKAGFEHVTDHLVPGDEGGPMRIMLRARPMASQEDG